jgi:hypothetical protein
MNASPAKRRKGIYKFVVHEDVCYLNTPINQEFENNWIKIENSGNITIKGSYSTGYAWDGCSPKINILDLFLFGTPDGRINVNTGKPVTYYASLIHDILYQFGKKIGIARKEADLLFLHYLGDFELRYLYYAAVRLFGGSSY